MKDGAAQTQLAPSPDDALVARLLGHYPAALRDQAADAIARGRVPELLRVRHPHVHGLRTDRALYGYVQGLKADHMRSGPPIDKVAYDSKLQVVQHALGLHRTVARVQGSRLKAKREIRIAAVFRDAPEAFLRMIAVHELAHLRERDHDRAFYALCEHMMPDYHQCEFDLRLYLAHLEGGGARLWSDG